MFISLSEKQQETVSGGHSSDIDMHDADDSDVLAASAKAKEKVKGYSAKIQAFQEGLLQLTEALTDT